MKNHLILHTNINLFYSSEDISAINIWLYEYRHSERTLACYVGAAQKLINWLANKSLTLKDISREIVQNYQDYLQNNYVSNSTKIGLSNATVNLQMIIISSMFQYLIELKYLKLNPFRLKKQSLPVEHTDDKFLTLSEWEILTNFIESLPQNTPEEIFNYNRIKWCFNLLYFTGCRRSEISSARMYDFVVRRNGWWLKIKGKGNKYGEIPVPNQLLLGLIAYRRSFNLTDYPSPEEKNIPLIMNKYGYLQPITTQTIYRVITSIANKLANILRPIDYPLSLKFRKISPHWLRHTSATHQLDAGVDFRVVKENLRHSNISTTLSYCHSSADKRHHETISNFGTPPMDNSEN